MNLSKNITLYANGCSFTTGYGIEGSEHNEDYSYIHSHAWPNRLGQLIGANEVCNQALAGGSNDRIVRTTIDWILKNWILPKKEISELLVVIGWTDHCRREFYIDGEWKQIIPYHRYPKWKSLNNLNKAYSKVAWSEQESLQRFGLQLITLQSFFHDYGINFFFFDAFIPVNQLIVEDPQFWSVYSSQIFKDNYWQFGSENGSMRSFLECNLPDWKERHPDEAGHLVWAKEMKEFIGC